jgi:hypothetical protein
MYANNQVTHVGRSTIFFVSRHLLLPPFFFFFSLSHSIHNYSNTTTHVLTRMSVANVPEALKSITPFLQRAAQLQEREPVVSYYCTFFVLAFSYETTSTKKATQHSLGTQQAGKAVVKSM